MGTKILTDIHNDLKLLITAISGFEENEDGFQICERFALSQIKHHRYLSVNGNAVKKEIDEITQKFLVHGKYDVAKEFRELVDTFITSFDFERHPQYDVQWSLLSLLLNLSNETNKSQISCNNCSSSRDKCHNVTVANEDDKSEEIDWARYLKEGEQEFFCDYHDSSDSDWSDDENDGQLDLSLQHRQKAHSTSKIDVPQETCNVETQSKGVFESLSQDVVSKKWLRTNIQHKWWNELDWHQYRVDSRFEAACLFEFWRKNIKKSHKIIGTLSEYLALRELLWMFHCQTGMVIFQEDKEKRFSIRDVSIPSLTTVAFKSILFSYCEYVIMVREMEDFIKNLFKKNDIIKSRRKPPLTYEAYAHSLQQEILSVKMQLVDFEVVIMKQNHKNTFLSMSRTLKKCTDRIKIIFEIHKSVIEDWEKSSNWQCASKLLSNLYFKIENSCNIEVINLSVSFYLSSLFVYLNIIDVWLSQGRFEDWREEFIIFKCSDSTDSSSREDCRPLEKFMSRKLDPLCMRDPVMKVLLHKVYQMGRSIELLVTLDRISDLWDMMGREQVFEKVLREECLKEILSACSEYDSTINTDSTDSATLQIIEIPMPDTSRDLEFQHKIIHQVVTTNNPFLSKALEGCIFTDIDSVDATNTSSMDKCKKHSKPLDFLKNVHTTLPWGRIFEYALSRVLDSKFNGASKLVKDILVDEYKLEVQLKLMRSIYMMETSYVMNQFCKLIFTEIESNGMWNNVYYITCLLEEILSQEWPESSSRWSIKIENIRTTKVLEAVDSTYLHYAAGWPINILLNDEALDKYNKIFRFELKLKWALWTLNTLRFSDLEGCVKTAAADIVQFFHIRRLESLRFWLLHAIGSIHSYLSGQVLLSLGAVLEKALAQADNLEAIVTIHSEYLDNVYEHCLQTEKFQDLTHAIYKLLEMCEKVRKRWKPESLSFIGKVLDQLENDYVKYHTYLALGLHNAVQHKDADYRKSEVAHELLQYVAQVQPPRNENSRKTIAERLDLLANVDWNED